MELDPDVVAEAPPEVELEDCVDGLEDCVDELPPEELEPQAASPRAASTSSAATRRRVDLVMVEFIIAPLFQDTLVRVGRA